MDNKINDKGPSSTEGRAMKVGDKVWVEVTVLDISQNSVLVRGYAAKAWWMRDIDCKPVEPEAVEQPAKKEPTEAQKIADRTMKAIWETHDQPEPEAVEQPTSDPVNPSHYKQGPAETIDIIEAAIAKAPSYKAAGLHWQVLKYALRCWFKNGIEDLKKARWYLDRLIQEEEAK
jgi:hypothetical protein